MTVPSTRMTERERNTGTEGILGRYNLCEDWVLVMKEKEQSSMISAFKFEQLCVC